jgi:hypothetical protein
MTTRTTLVPRDAVDVASFIDNFRADHGITPLGGGEGYIGAPPAAPEATPEPAAPAQAAPAEPAAPAPQPPPEWAQPLFDRMDQIAPPAPPDPAAVDLGFVDPPPVGQPPQQQPQSPASPGLGQPPQQPGTPFPGAPQSQDDQVKVIQDWVAQEVEKGVAARLAQDVEPRFQALRQAERQQEIDGLRQDYTEFQDPQKATEIVSRARQWGELMERSLPPQFAGLGEALAREPAYLEQVLLAGAQMDARRVRQAQQPPTGAAPQLPTPLGYPIEQPGAAAPAPPIDPQQAIQQRIVAAGNGSGLSSVWH